MFWVVYDPYFAQKKIITLIRHFLAKITANVQKKIKVGLIRDDFLYGENIDHTKKKSYK